MKKSLIAAAMLSMSLSALATSPGNNGGGNGGCGYGQQTNGCGGGGAQGPAGPQGPQGPAGKDGKDGRNGVDGKDGRNGIDGKDGVGVAGANGRDGRDGESITGPQGAQGVAPPNTATVQDVTNAVQAATAQTNQQLSGMRDEIHRVGKNAYSGVAVAMALQMPALNPYKPDALTMRAGVGAFKGQGAVGISFRKGNKVGDWSVSGGVAHSNAGVGVALGIEHSF